MSAEASLDYSSSDLFVLLAGQVFQDVALWLQRESHFTTSEYVSNSYYMK